MASDCLKSVVSFAGVAAGAQATLPHGLQVNGTGYAPDRVSPAKQLFDVVAATATDLTIVNNGIQPLDCDFLCELWHPIERQFGRDPDDGSLSEHLTPRPFVSNRAQAADSPGVISGVTKNLVNGAVTPIVAINFANVPDNTFAAKLFYSVECSDGTDQQIVAGECNALVARKLPATWNTAHAEDASNAKTSGTLTVEITWSTAAAIATLNIKATSTLAPTQLYVRYFIFYSTHDAFTYV